MGGRTYLRRFSSPPQCHLPSSFPALSQKHCLLPLCGEAWQDLMWRRSSSSVHIGTSGSTCNTCACSGGGDENTVPDRGDSCSDPVPGWRMCASGCQPGNSWGRCCYCFLAVGLGSGQRLRGRLQRAYAGLPALRSGTSGTVLRHLILTIYSSWAWRSGIPGARSSAHAASPDLTAGRGHHIAEEDHSTGR